MTRMPGAMSRSQYSTRQTLGIPVANATASLMAWHLHLASTSLTSGCWVQVAVPQSMVALDGYARASMRSDASTSHGTTVRLGSSSRVKWNIRTLQVVCPLDALESGITDNVASEFSRQAQVHQSQSPGVLTRGGHWPSGRKPHERRYRGRGRATTLDGSSQSSPIKDPCACSLVSWCFQASGVQPNLCGTGL
jgi:hypothetical protein